MQAARFFSAVFHPFCIPLIGMSCLLYGHTMLALFSTVSKLYVLWVLAALTLIMPFALLRALRWTGIFRWLPDDERGRQALMMLVFLVCYLGAGGMLWHFLAVDMIRRIFFGGIMLLAIGFGVNKYWPVGLHLMAIGAMTGFLFSTQVTRFGEVTGLLLVTIAAAGVLGSARIYLGRNDLAQVGIGFGIGFWLMFLFTFL
ncbi:MAG: hypothetical protein LBU80_03830 [Rikenellaceae bacterium]|nr:hypothetical protein [Rikenellaceae bacterium]